MFRAAKVVVFVDGCFWHSCPVHGTMPKNNAEWWQQKLEANRRRDADTDLSLRASGWSVVRVWEHEDVRTAADRIEELVRGNRPSRIDPMSH